MHDRNDLLTDEERAAERDFDASDLLTDAQRARHAGWLIDGYRAALRRIRLHYGFSDDEPPNPWGPHWETEDDMTHPGSPLVHDWSGPQVTPATARRRAFELLAHADLAETQQP